VRTAKKFGGKAFLRQDVEDKAEFTRQGQMQVTHSDSAAARAPPFSFSVSACQLFATLGNAHNRGTQNSFSKLHQRGLFCDSQSVGHRTAKYLQHLGFKAIATTSAGFAFSRGLSDGAVKRDDMLAHIKEFGRSH